MRVHCDKCPGRTFKNAHGLQIHTWKTHGVSNRKAKGTEVRAAVHNDIASTATEFFAALDKMRGLITTLNLLLGDVPRR